MRWPIRIQLLLPMVSIVVLAIVLATAASTYLSVAGARRRQAEQLRRVVATLTEASFPLSETVLKQMSGLSGGQFVLLDDRQAVVHSTIPLGRPDLEVLRQIRGERSLDLFSRNVVELTGRAYFADLVPVAARRRASHPRSLIVLYPQDRWWAVARQAAYPILSGGAVAVLVGMLVSMPLAGRFVRPIKALGDQAMAIADGSFQPLDVPRRNDEIADLTLLINRMTDRLSRYETEVRRNEQLRILGQLGAGMAHQMRNAATGARMAIELHQRRAAEASEVETLGTALRQLRLMESHLQRFITLARAEPVPHEPVALERVLDEVLELVRPACDHAKIRLGARYPDRPVRVEGDAHALGQLLTNLVFNAIHAVGSEVESAGEIRLELERSDAARAILCVKDSGPGPGADVAGNLFEPFVTDKPDGTGLGLYLARQVAEAHGGTIRWERRESMTCFVVELPALGIDM